MYIKYFNDVDHREEFIKGNIILRHYNYYRLSEKSNGDPNEFSVSRAGSTRGLCNDAFILSASEKFTQKCKDKFGEHYLVIKDSIGFFKMLKKELSPFLKFPQISNFGQVSYYEPSSKDQLHKVNYYNEFSNENVDAPVHTPFRKSSAYAEEKEVRMCFFYDINKLKDCNTDIIRLRYFKRMMCSNMKFPKSHLENVLQGYLTDPYINKFLNQDKETNVVEFDNFEDYQSHYSDSKRWNYRIEYYIEMHIKVGSLEKYILTTL